MDTIWQFSVHLDSGETGSFISAFLARLSVFDKMPGRNLIYFFEGFSVWFGLFWFSFYYGFFLFYIFCFHILHSFKINQSLLESRTRWSEGKLMCCFYNTRGILDLFLWCQLSSRWWNFPFGVIISSHAEKIESWACQNHSRTLCIFKIGVYHEQWMTLTPYHAFIFCRSRTAVRWPERAFSKKSYLYCKNAHYDRERRKAS